MTRTPGRHLKFYDLAAWRALKGWDKNSVTADAQIAFNPDTLELTITSSKPLPRVGAVNQIQTICWASRRERTGLRARWQIRQPRAPGSWTRGC